MKAIPLLNVQFIPAKDYVNTHLLMPIVIPLEIVKHQPYGFEHDVDDLKTTPVIFIISHLEQSAVVWHSSLTEQKTGSLELETVEERRE